MEWAVNMEVRRNLLTSRHPPLDCGNPPTPTPKNTQGRLEAKSAVSRRLGTALNVSPLQHEAAPSILGSICDNARDLDEPDDVSVTFSTLRRRYQIFGFKEKVACNPLPTAVSDHVPG